LLAGQGHTPFSTKYFTTFVQIVTLSSDDKNHEKEISGGEVQFVEDLIKRHQGKGSLLLKSPAITITLGAACSIDF
jgi:hypothetical protein